MLSVTEVHLSLETMALVNETIKKYDPSASEAEMIKRLLEIGYATFLDVPIQLDNLAVIPMNWTNFTIVFDKEISDALKEKIDSYNEGAEGEYEEALMIEALIKRGFHAREASQDQDDELLN